MSTRRVIRSLVVLAASLGGLAAAQPAHAQQSGSITGRVTDASSGQPVVGAQISVVGTTLGSQTNGAGQFTIRGVRPGPTNSRDGRRGRMIQWSSSCSLRKGLFATHETDPGVAACARMGHCTSRVPAVSATA